MDGTDIKNYSIEDLNNLIRALQQLVDIIDAHDLASLSCDRDGNEFCDCLDAGVTQAKKVLYSLQYIIR